MKKLIISFGLALNNIKSNLLHTLLSVLGIVIGVAALVAILSLIDGMEKFAHEQISRTTSIEAVVVNTENYKKEEGLTIKKDTFDYFSYSDFKAISSDLAHLNARPFYHQSKVDKIQYGDKEHVSRITFSDVNVAQKVVEIDYGRFFNEQDISDRKSTIINDDLALLITSDSIETLLSQNIFYRDSVFSIVGVIKDKGNRPQAYFPITLLTEAEIIETPPILVFEAPSVEEVPAIKEGVENWISKNYGETKDLKVSTNEMWVEQANKGFLVFRVIMGLIVGISVVVGGIGVMNVLIISVTERTFEIGVRKAMGAKKSDILVQFLSESITISAFGSMVGLLIGTLFTMTAVPIVKQLIKMPFEAAYTLNTFVVISVISILVGIIFGTYPAIKASRLDPVEAIRHE